MRNTSILIIEDDFCTLQVLKTILEKENYSTIPVDNVDDALNILKREKIDLIISDWMMPNIDGIEFLYRLKSNFKDPPPVIIITALTSEMARSYAIRSGAVEFIEKPINIPELLQVINKILESQKSIEKFTSEASQVNPPFIGIGIVSGNGGTKPLIDILLTLKKDLKENFVVTVIQQGNKYLIDSLVTKLNQVFSQEVIVPISNLNPKPGKIYIAPFDHHLFFSKNYELIVDNGPKENYQRPSAEPMFRSLANYFGKYSIAVILSGLGTDGVQSAIQIKFNGGYVICQEPSTAAAPTLPKSFISPFIDPIVLPPDSIPFEIKKIIKSILLQKTG